MKLLKTSDKKENLKISHNKKFCYRHKTNSELQLTSHQKPYTRQERNEMFKLLKEKKYILTQNSISKDNGIAESAKRT